MPKITNRDLCRILGRSVASAAKLRNRFSSFPRPTYEKLPHGRGLFHDSDAIRAWIIAHADELQPRYVNEVALDIGLFDERLALILAQKAEPTI